MASATSRATTSSFPAWEYAFLKLIGAPQNEAQLQALNNWARAEGMPDGANNWLAFTAPATDLNMWGTVGSSSNVDQYGGPRQAIAPGQWNLFDNGKYSVVTYPTMAAGVQALYEFLSHGHDTILRELKNPNATITSIGDAITADKAWGNDGKKIIAYSNGGVYSGGGQTGGGANITGKGFTQCGNNGAVIGTPSIPVIGSFTLINQCQGKALVGGFLIGMGGFLMLQGVLLTTVAVGLNSGVVQAAVNLIPGGGTVAQAAKGAVSGIKPRRSSSTAGALRGVSRSMAAK